MKKYIHTFLIIFLPIILLVGYYFATLDSRDIEIPATLLKKIDNHYVLPKDEEPAIATVTDKSKVATEFLRSAKNGDKILIYQEAKLALVYRPSIDRLITVGPVNISGSEPGSLSTE